MRYQYVDKDDDDDEIVNYKKWTRIERLADWRIFAVLMILIASLVGSGLPQWYGVSIVMLLFISKIGSVGFIVAILFYVFWGIALYTAISGRGFRCVTISGICFMCYQIVPLFIRFVYMWLAEWLHSKKTLSYVWEETFSRIRIGFGFHVIFIAGMVLLFMGICFGAQQKVAEKKRRIERM